MGMDGRVGTGPGDDRVGPIYKVVQWNPHAEGLADIPAAIDTADAHDIVLLAYTPGSAANFGLNVGVYDSAKYNDQLDKLDAIPEFRDAVRTRPGPLLRGRRALSGRLEWHLDAGALQ